jgi:hypothetical protein
MLRCTVEEVASKRRILAATIVARLIGNFARGYGGRSTDASAESCDLNAERLLMIK